MDKLIISSNLIGALGAMPHPKLAEPANGSVKNFQDFIKSLKKDHIHSYQVEKMVKDRQANVSGYQLKVNHEQFTLKEKSPVAAHVTVCTFATEEILFDQQVMPRNFLNEVAKKLTKIVEDINNNSAAVTLEKEKGEKL